MYLSLPNYFTRFMSPDEGVGGDNTPEPTGEIGKEEVIEILAEDDDKAEILEIDSKKDKTDDKPVKTKKDDDKEDDETDEVDEELKALEEELEEPTEEQLELMTPVRRREILKKYPELFKDFPYLERAYYREQQFTEILPTIDDAKMAVAKAGILDRFEADIASGNTETILTQVRKEDPNAFLKIVDDYLPTLARVDKDAYHHVLGNITKHTIWAMVQEGKRSQNEVLQSAAQILNQFVFGSSDFTPPRNLSNPNGVKQPANNEVDERERQFVERQYRSTVDDLNTKVNNTLKATIEAHIDTNQSMTDYVRKNASKDAMEKLEELIAKDSRFRQLTDKLWRNAQENNFSKDSTDRIRSAFLSKAKTLLPSVIKKARHDALKGMGKKVSEDKTDSVETGNNKGPVTPGRPRSNSSGKITSPKEIPAGMSTIDFLNS
jgi:hypothetical protein